MPAKEGGVVGVGEGSAAVDGRQIMLQLYVTLLQPHHRRVLLGRKLNRVQRLRLRLADGRQVPAAPAVRAVPRE